MKIYTNSPCIQKSLKKHWPDAEVELVSLDKLLEKPEPGKVIFDSYAEVCKALKDSK